MDILARIFLVYWAAFLAVANANNLPLFSGPEHQDTVAQAEVICPDDMTEKNARACFFNLESGAIVTIADVVAIAGDFFSIVGDSIARQKDSAAPINKEDKLRFLSFYNVLAQADPDIVAKIVGQEGEYTKNRANFTHQQQLVNKVLIECQGLGNACYTEKLRQVYSGLTCEYEDILEDFHICVGGIPVYAGKYVELASTNFDHFQPESLRAYATGHRVALESAQDYANGSCMDYMSISKIDRKHCLERAYLQEAYALHFLTDSFSSGHVRVPRRMAAGSKELNLLARAQHNEDSHYGLWVKNSNHDEWKIYGDDLYFAPVSKVNRAMVHKTVKLSVAEITYALKTGELSAANFKTSKVAIYIPRPDSVAKFQSNSAPLLIEDEDDMLKVRNGDICSFKWYRPSLTWWYAVEQHRSAITGEFDYPVDYQC